MFEFFDVHTNLQVMMMSLEERKRASLEQTRAGKRRTLRRKRVFDPRIFQVRPSICITGFNGSAIQRVKTAIASLTDRPLPLESFLIRKQTDVKDGALLVPKVILVAVHCPGKKLIDDQGNEGQLDLIYDEVCDLGADCFVVYLNLPRIVYPPVKNCIYHPKVADLIFPGQPVIQSLAINYGLMTLTEGADFNSIQKNLLREWVTRPVASTHRIYRTAESMTETSQSEAEWASENEARFSRVARFDDSRRSLSSVEDERTVTRKSKLLSKKRKYGSVRTNRDLGETRHLLRVEEVSNSVELELYNESYSYHTDSVRSEQV